MNLFAKKFHEAIFSAATEHKCLVKMEPNTYGHEQLTGHISLREENDSVVKVFCRNNGGYIEISIVRVPKENWMTEYGLMLIPNAMKQFEGDAIVTVWQWRKDYSLITVAIEDFKKALDAILEKEESL